ncbi:MAG: ABC transporter ATP-binding protein/permease [Gordonia sp. (in: high G+C Gram-positive bacteria)]|uniref:ABC transporter ATP-binding protein/permease n=1 Tax=Gordonia sp. (in: high G+C Gram-positive bacteria) TaxID=84139 RepID=UPI0039E27481
MEPFEYSIDWSAAAWDSLLWIAKAWAIAAVVTMIVLVLLLKFTVWGRQFWRVTRGYFTGPGSGLIWVWLAVILLIVMAGVRLDVLFSYQGNDLYSSIQTAVQGLSAGDEKVKQSGMDGFWTSLGRLFVLLATLHVIRQLLDLFLTQRFMLNWRAWLTDELTGDWLTDRAYYRSRFIDDSIDNPDQRIQADVDVFTTGVGPETNTPGYIAESTLLFGAITSVASVIAFTEILWNLSGDLTILDLTIPRAMFWTAFAYVAIATVIAFWIGRPIIRLAFRNEKYNAGFRYSLVRLRDASESVAFYRGESAEREQLRGRFALIVANYKSYIVRMLAFKGWNLSMSQAIVPIPWLIQAPRLFDGQIKMGDVTQTASAFGSIADGLSFFRNAYDSFAGWRAAVIRLHGLVIADEQSRALPALDVQPSTDDTVSLVDVDVRTPDGAPLVTDLNLSLQPGDALLVTGRSGSGKTTLLRSLGQLWPYTSGTMARPDGLRDILFMSQLPYVPLGDLRSVVSYPFAPGEIDDAALDAVLRQVSLPHSGGPRLDEVRDWAKVLSPGEQQRVAFARLLLTRPKAAFLDEATSALDEGLEFQMYALVRSELPETILVSVSHRSTLERHHTRELRLNGIKGSWRVGDIGELGDMSPAR